MGKLERITVTMPEEMAAKLRAAVDAGSYATTSEIVREALRDWTDDQQRRQASLERVKGLISQADASPSHDSEKVFAELRAYVAEKAAEARAGRD
jgi:antitoxin ParD1/3/4